jgi:hypothetical protein
VSERNAARTVLQDTRVRTSLMESPSALCSRPISARSSTSNKSFPPGSAMTQGSTSWHRQWCTVEEGKSEAAIRGPFSSGDDTLHALTAHATDTKIRLT